MSPPDLARVEALARERAADVARLAVRLGATVAVAESLTGGLVLGTLAGVPGVSAVLRGGVVAYATDLKAALLGVDVDLLARGGAVQAEVAAQMARGVADRLGADYALATTGVAGPDPQDGHPPGVVHIALFGPLGTRVVSHTESRRVRGDRSRIRWTTVVLALSVLTEALALAETRAEEDGGPGR